MLPMRRTASCATIREWLIADAAMTKDRRPRLSMSSCNSLKTIRLRLRGAELLGSFSPVRVVLHRLCRGRLVDPRIGEQAACIRRICHLLGKYAEARPIRVQRRPVSRGSQQWLVMDNDLVDQDLHPTFEIVLGLENRFGRIVGL